MFSEKQSLIQSSQLYISKNEKAKDWLEVTKCKLEKGGFPAVFSEVLWNVMDALEARWLGETMTQKVKVDKGGEIGILGMESNTRKALLWNDLIGSAQCLENEASKLPSGMKQGPKAFEQASGPASGKQRVLLLFSPAPAAMKNENLEDFLVDQAVGIDTQLSFVEKNWQEVLEQPMTSLALLYDFMYHFSWRPGSNLVAIYLKEPSYDLEPTV